MKLKSQENFVLHALKVEPRTYSNYFITDHVSTKVEVFVSST